MQSSPSLSVLRAIPAGLRSLTLLACVLALGALSSCPAKDKSSGDSTKVTVQTTEKDSADKDTAADSSADTSASADGADADADAAADGSTAEDADKSGDTAAAGADAKDGDKDDESAEEDGDKDAPKPAAASEPKGIWVSVDFMNAQWNEDPEAKISHLLFDLGADLARNDNVTDEIKLSDPDSEVYGQLDLRFCKVRVYPYVGNAKITRDSGSKQEYTRNGRYVFMLFDENDKTLGVLEMDYDGEFRPAPPENQPSGATIMPVFDKDHDHVGYDITQQLQQGQPVKTVLQVRINRGAFVTQQVTDPLGNVFVYRFPEIHLLLAPPGVDTTKPQRPV